MQYSLNENVFVYDKRGFSGRNIKVFTKVITYIEVAEGDIFMEHKMRFGLVLGRLAILKKNWGLIMSNF